jgi:hypothetical protein
MLLLSARLQVALVLSVAGALHAQLATAPSPEHIAYWNKEIGARQRVCSLQGIVVDMDGAPVSGATVVLAVRRYSPGTTTQFAEQLEDMVVTVPTDSQGRFEAAGLSGMEVCMSAIEKEGYAYSSMTTAPRRVYSAAELAARPQERFTFRVRKRGPTAFLLKDMLLDIFDPNKPSKVSLDIIGMHMRRVRGVATEIDTHRMVDVWYEAEYLPTEEYELTLHASSDGGIQEAGELYQAPEQGYGPEVKIRLGITGMASKTVHLYTQSRKPAIYAKLTLGMSASDSQLDLSWTITTNPYGDRSLEESPELELVPVVSVELANQAQAAFARGERPSRPDIKALVRSAQKTGAASQPSTRP